MLDVHHQLTGFFQTNCWVLEEREERICAVIDPGGGSRKIWRWLQELGLAPKLILLTHGHLDHIMAAHYLQRKSKAPCLLHPLDNERRWRWLAFSLARFTPVADSQILRLGTAEIKVIHTPGHSPGSVSYLVNDFLFSGDLLFADGVGRWDVPGGNFGELVKSLRERLQPLPDSVNIFPGHGPATILGDERKRNPIFWPKEQI